MGGIFVIKQSWSVAPTTGRVTPLDDVCPLEGNASCKSDRKVSKGTSIVGRRNWSMMSDSRLPMVRPDPAN